MPTSTSLVTNLPADFNTFGQAVDTSMSELLGGTTGQVLSKTSNTNMDFTWVTPTDQTPLTTKGDIFAFSTVDARLPAGTNETRLVADSTQTLGLKYVADTTNYAIAAKGDLLAGTAADTLSALSVGTNAQVLTADSTTATGLKWATPTAGGMAWTLLNAGGTALTGSQTITVSGISGANQVMVVFVGASSGNASDTLAVRINTDTTTKYNAYGTYIYSPAAYVTGGISQDISSTGVTYISLGAMSGAASSAASGYCLITGANSTGPKVFQSLAGFSRAGNDSQQNYILGGVYTGTSTVSSISMFAVGANFDAGTVYVYTTA